MAGNGGYRIVIGATDAASPVIDGANKRIEAMTKRINDAQAPFKRLSENFDAFTKVSGLDKVATGFKDVATAGIETSRSMLRIIEPLSAITGAASIAGMYRLVTAWGEFSTALGQQAARAGTSTDSLYNLQNAAKLAGVSAETMTGSVTALNDNLRNAAFGGAPQFLMILRNLGLSYDELTKMTPEKRIKAVADALAKVKSPTDKALYTSGIFGGQGLLPLLNLTGKGIEDLEKRARDLTGTFGGVMAAAGASFAQSLRELDEASGGLGKTIAGVVGPAIQPFIVMASDAVVLMRKWVETNQAWLRGEISAKVGEMVTWLKGVEWSAIGKDIKGIWTNVNGVAAGLGGWVDTGKTVLEFFVGTWAVRMLGTIASVAAAIVGLPVAATAAMAQVAGIMGFLGFKGAERGGQQVGEAADLGWQVTGTDEFGAPTMFRDRQGMMRTAERAGRSTERWPRDPHEARRPDCER